MSKCRNHPSIKQAFNCYEPFDKFKNIRPLYGHIEDRIYRRCAFYYVFDRIENLCMFSICRDVLLHMMSLTASEDELLSYIDAYEFAIEYAKSQLKENELVVTDTSLCCQYDKNFAILMIEKHYGSIAECFNLRDDESEHKSPRSLYLGAYFNENSGALLSTLFKNEKCHEHLRRRDRTFNISETSIAAIAETIGKICIYADSTILSLFDRDHAITKETIMFSIDCTIGHERRHKEIDNPFGHWQYISEHWKPAFNLTGFNAVEQECNRSGLIYAVKQYHKRLRKNCVCGNRKYRKSKSKGTANV